MPSSPKENHKDFFQHFFQIGTNQKVTIGSTANPDRPYFDPFAELGDTRALGRLVTSGSTATPDRPSSFDPWELLGDPTRPLGRLMAILMLGSRGSLEKLVVVLVGGAEGLLTTENDLT